MDLSVTDDGEDGRRLLKIRVPTRLALALEARRLLSGESKSKTVEDALQFYLAKQDQSWRPAFVAAGDPRLRP